MPENDPSKIPLPRKYAPLLGPVVGALAGSSAFLKMELKDASMMVALFSVIGLVAGLVVFLYDLKRKRA